MRFDALHRGGGSGIVRFMTRRRLSNSPISSAVCGVLLFVGAPDFFRASCLRAEPSPAAVAAFNAYIGAVAPALSRRILGVGTYIIATEPLGEARARSLLPSNAAVADINWILDYFRRSRDHRLLFGGRVSYSSVQPPRLAESMRQRMVRVFPSLSDVKVANAWGGYLDITMSRAPDFGRLAPNVYYLQGFSGHGVALAGLAGELASDAIAGTAERFDVFARIPHRDFPGGRLLRRPSLMLAMLYYRLRDLL